MNNYRNMDANSAAVAYCDAQERDNADWSSSQLRAIDRRINDAKSDMLEYGAIFINNERISIEEIIDAYDEEFISIWVHEYFIFNFTTQEGKAGMYETMRGAFIDKALAALDDDLKNNNGHKYFYDIVGEE